MIGLGGHGVGAPLRRCEKMGALVQEAVGEPGLREREGKLRVSVGRSLRRGRQQAAKCRQAAVEDQAEVVAGEHARRVAPVARRLRVADRLDHVAVRLVPLGGRPVERADGRGREPPQLEPQEVGEQLVIAEP